MNSGFPSLLTLLLLLFHLLQRLDRSSSANKSLYLANTGFIILHFDSIRLLYNIVPFQIFRHFLFLFSFRKGPCIPVLLLYSSTLLISYSFLESIVTESTKKKKKNNTFSNNLVNFCFLLLWTWNFKLFFSCSMNLPNWTLSSTRKPTKNILGKNFTDIGCNCHRFLICWHRFLLGLLLGFLLGLLSLYLLVVVGGTIFIYSFTTKCTTYFLR